MPISPELYEWAAVEGRQKWFGGVAVQKNQDGKTAFVTFDHTLLGNFLDPDELSSAVYMMGWTADDLDDLVTTKFGGKRWSRLVAVDTRLLRDEAIQLAKSHGDEAVEPRHVLAALLGPWGPAPRRAGRRRSSTRCSARPAARGRRPSRRDAAEALLAELAKATPDQAVEIAKRVAANPPDAAPTRGRRPRPPTRERPPSSTRPPTRRPTLRPPTRRPRPRRAKESTQEILAELDALVGLAAAKEAVRRAMAVQALNAERRKQGLPVVGASQHMVFIGPAGTGKTTVARIVARLYGSMGLLSKGHLVETGRADLVAGYVGQTAIKVAGGGRAGARRRAVHRRGLRARGRRLQRLRRRGDRDPRQAHGGPPRRPPVIVAGYPDEMRTFIDSNPGLRSRFTTYVGFDDYSVDELIEIFGDMAAKAKVDLGQGSSSRPRR